MMLKSATLIGAATLLLASTAAAATPAQVVEAERTYQQGKTLMDAKAYDKAIEAFSRSQALDPAVGTLVLLAECHENVGHLARAFELFKRAEAEAEASGKAKSKKKASEHIATLGARLSFLTVRLVPEDGAAEVDLDGVRIEAAHERVVEPGNHELHVTVAGNRWASALPLVAGKRTFEVPRVSPKPVAATVPTPSIAPVVVAAPARGGVGVQRIGGIATTAGGVVAMGLGLAIGASALGQRSDAEGLCPDRSACATQEGADRWSNAASTGTTATIVFVTGAVLTAVGAVMWITAPSDSSTKIGWRFGPNGVGGTF